MVVSRLNVLFWSILQLFIIPLTCFIILFLPLFIILFMVFLLFFFLILRRILYVFSTSIVIISITIHSILQLISNIPQSTKIHTRIFNPIETFNLFDIVIIYIKALKRLDVLDKAWDLGDQVVRKIDACKIGKVSDLNGNLCDLITCKFHLFQTYNIFHLWPYPLQLILIDEKIQYLGRIA